jgi:hypothetical protein
VGARDAAPKSDLGHTCPRPGLCSLLCRGASPGALVHCAGRSLLNSLYNLNVKDLYGEALRQLGYDLETLKEEVRLLPGWVSKPFLRPTSALFPEAYL